MPTNHPPASLTAWHGRAVSVQIPGEDIESEPVEEPVYRTVKVRVSKVGGED
jgi:hypothetical protein